MTRHSEATSSLPASDGPTQPMIQCRSVDKRFGTTPALSGVDLDLEAGEILAVTGESGSGKSTLLLCLAGILRPEGGNVWFQGRDLGNLSDDELTELRRRDFGFVFQMGYLVPDLPAILNVALPLILGGERRSRAESLAQGWLQRFGVQELADRHPADMSVGQSQRVAVARAMVTGPRVIFADEPTGSLDSGNSARVIEMFLEAARDRGSAVVLVTHSAGIARVADREVVLRDGRLVREER